MHFQTLVADGRSIEFTYYSETKSFKCHRDTLDGVDIEVMHKLKGLLPDIFENLETVVNGAVSAGDDYRDSQA